MDKKLAGALAALTVLTPLGAHAATSPSPGALQATSFDQLLEPVPNAMAALRSIDAAQSTAPKGNEVQVAQWHHHHHHHRDRRWRDHHHHHHYRHHHHHHHHHYDDDNE